MYKHGFPRDWSTLKKLIWLQGSPAMGENLPWTEFTGNPLSVFVPKIHDLREATVEFEPQQDLHGYANPWPPGGGVNKCPSPSAQTSTVNGKTMVCDGNGGITFSGTPTGTADFTFQLDEVTLPDTVYIHLFNTLGFDSDRPTVNFYDGSTNLDFVGLTSANRIYDGTTAMAGKKLNKIMIRVPASRTETFSMKLYISTSPTVTTYSPYSNICPISGRTGADVYHTGANLLPITNENNTYKGNGQYFTLTYGENGVTFTPTVSGSLFAVWKAFVVTPAMVGEKVTLSFELTGGDAKLVYSDTADGEFNNSGTIIVNGQGTYTITDGVVGRAIGIRFANSTGAEQTLSNVMFSFSDTALPYEPYDGETYEVTFGVTSANQWDEEWANGYFNTTTGAFVESASNTSLCSKNYIPATGGATYCFVQPTSTGPQVYQYDKDYGYIGRITSISSNNGTFTVDSNCAFIKFAVFNYGNGQYNSNVAINYPASVTAYNPYSEECYGGSYNFVTGELTGMWAEKDMGDLVWTYVADDQIFRANVADAKAPATNAERLTEITCSAYKVASGYLVNMTSMGDKSFLRYSQRVAVADSAYTDVTLFTAAVAGQQYVYPLATPLTFQLPPQTIETLKGTNVFFTDGKVITILAKAKATA